MVKFYINKELSQKFNVNLAKWKRWSREFLPPDPLGGLQSGYARQYNPDEAFTVSLGGHLVGDLKFTIPEARYILHDLQQWLVDHDFYFDFSGTARPAPKSAYRVKNYQIAISSRNIAGDNDTGFSYGFSYLVQGVIEDKSIDLHGVQVRQQCMIESSIGPGKNETGLTHAESYRVLNISAFRKKFLNDLQGGETGY